jgi:fermentation-respiration switch protein FrsA (DUF1100 family)
MDLGIEWAQKDPRRAGAYLVEHGEKWDHDHTLIHVVSHWSYRDAPGALDWISSLPASEIQGKLFSSVLGNYARSDPLAAAEFLQRLAPAQRKGLSSSVAGAWASLDPPAAARWASSVPDAAERDEAVTAVVSSWAAVAPAAAATWLERMPRGPARDRAVVQFARTVDSSDPEGAAAWAATISDPQQRGNAVYAVASRWIGRDAPAGRAWVQQTPLLAADQKEQLLRQSR